MSPVLMSLCYFAGWTILLVVLLAAYRVSTALRGEKELTTFSPDGSDLPGFGSRLTRAHLNCLEMLPVFAAVALIAVATDKVAITNGLAMSFFYARLIQSVAHLVSGSFPFVLIRATFFVVQIVILVIWIYSFV